MEHIISVEIGATISVDARSAWEASRASSSASWKGCLFTRSLSVYSVSGIPSAWKWSGAASMVPVRPRPVSPMFGGMVVPKICEA